MGELSPPWLDNDFLTDCLRNGSNNQNIIVNDFTVESAVPPGNNYGSVVARVKLNYTDKSSTRMNKLSKTLIIKLPLTHGTIKDLYGDSVDIEPVFYKQYLPKAYDQLKNEFAPKCYPTSSTLAVVVLDDLKEAGFVMADRMEKLDFGECLRYVESAAAFHGGSVRVLKPNSDLTKQLCAEKVFSDEIKAVNATKNMIRYGLDCMANRILMLTGDERISSIIKRCSTELWDMLVDVVKPSGNFDTLNQGDPWLTNMMFKYDDKGNCVEMKILDYQGLRYASPATDLAFFLWTSAKHYVREDKFEEVIQTYVKALNRNLEEMNCSEKLSLDFFKKELLRASPIALYVCSLCLPLYQAEAPDVSGIFAQCGQEYSPDNNPLAAEFTTEFCTNDLVRLVKQLETQKIFDYLEMYLDKSGK